MKRQRIKRGRRRLRLSACVERRLDAWVRQQATGLRCSLSYVQALCIATASGIPIDGIDMLAPTRHRKRRGAR